MTHTYHIHGMTCNGCRAHVEHTLSQVEGVSKASVDLEKSEATIEMEAQLLVETYEEALHKEGRRYSIKAPGHHHHEGQHHKDHPSNDSHPQCQAGHADAATPAKKGK